MYAQVIYAMMIGYFIFYTFPFAWTALGTVIIIGDYYRVGFIHLEMGKNSAVNTLSQHFRCSFSKIIEQV